MRGLLPEEAWKARGALRATSLKGRPPQHHISKRGREACVWPSTPPSSPSPWSPPLPAEVLTAIQSTLEGGRR